MTEEQAQHVQAIAKDFTKRIIPKYEAGAIEHGTNVWDHPPEALIEHATEEVLDQFVYLYTLKEQLYG